MNKSDPMPPLTVRPVTLDDLDQLEELTRWTSFGLTTLPKDRDLLAKRVKSAVRGLTHVDDDEPLGQSYLFVLEEPRSGRILGTAGILSKVGGFEPFYAYRIETSIHESKMLNVRKEIKVLHLIEEHNGPSEIGSLFLHPDARGGGHGRLLSLSRFLFMAEYPKLFDAQVIAEMRGVIDDNGHSHFWDSLGRHFFDIELPKADYLSIVNKEFIGDLMPRHPIYIPLLPKAAQRVIGEVHELTQPARRLLEKEGFRFFDQVDIFEAGPILHCARESIRTIRESRTAPIAAIANLADSGTEALVGTSKRIFRACRGRLQLNQVGLTIDEAVATALAVETGDQVRFLQL